MSFETTTDLKPLSTSVPSRYAVPMKIGILSYRSNPRVGGQGVYLDYLSRALVNAGHEVTIFSGPPYPIVDPRIKVIEIPSLDLYSKPHHGHFALRPKHLLSPTDSYEYFGHLSGKFVEPFVFGQRIKKYFHTHRPAFDVLLDNQTLALGVLEASRALGVPLVTMIHHPITEDRRLALAAANGWKQKWLVRRWYAFHQMQLRVAKQLGTVLTPSESARRHVVKEFGLDPSKVFAVPLGVDQIAFHHDPTIIRAKQRIITTASADVPLKGLRFLIDAYAKLLAKHPDLKLRVIGKLRNGEAKQLIETHGLMDRIEFRSGLSREELAYEFQSATLLVSPSLYEGFGLPAAEAMSCGTPVIVTDGGALPEVAGDAARIVPKANSEALAREIDRLLSNPVECRRVGEACLARAQKYFDWRNIAPQYVKHFEAAIKNAC